jgi:hypothetical protein
MIFFLKAAQLDVLANILAFRNATTLLNPLDIALSPGLWLFPLSFDWH